MAKKTPKLVYDESEDGWTGTIQFPALADCAIRWSVDDEGIYGPHKLEQTKAQRAKMPVVLLSENGEEPTDVQWSSLDKFLAKQDSICKELLKYALNELSSAYYDESLPPLQECTGKAKATRKRLSTVAGFQELIEPTCVYVREEEKDGVSYLAIDFNTALDEEHGFSVLLHDEQPLGWAGAGERGGDIPPASTAADQADFAAEIAALADARIQVADVLKTATNPETADTATEKLPPLIDNVVSATSPINARINERGSGLAAMKTLRGNSAIEKASKKLDEQLRRIAKDRKLCKVLDPVLRKLDGWKTLKQVVREFG